MLIQTAILPGRLYKMERAGRESKTMGGISIRQSLWFVALLALAGCDAGPSAVVHDGDGRAVSSPSAGTPAYAANTTDGDEPEVSMPVIDGSTGSMAASEAPVDHSIAPHYGESVTVAAAGPADIGETRYGDWPLWSKNRKYSPDDNAHYQFGKHGVEFGAKSYPQYLAMVHGFIHHPPAGTESLKRKNGDTLFYNVKDNIFAVMTKTGAPRTMFRPDSGRTYWEQQKVVEAERLQKPTNGPAGGED